MNKNSIRKIIKSTLELIGAMATIILLVGFLNGYSVRLSTDLYGLLDNPIYFSWIYAFIVAFVLSIWGYIIDENRGNDE